MDSKIKKLQTFSEDKDLATFDELQEVNQTLSETKEVIGNLVQAIKEIKIPEVPTSLTIDGGALKGEQGPQGEKGENGRDSTVPGPAGRDGAIGAQGKDGRDGVDGERGEDGRDGSPDSPIQIKDKLESLKGDGRLDLSAIKGTETLSLKKDVERAIDILDQRSQFLINKTTSSGGSGTVTSVSVTTANGISGTVATATTTPAITLDISALDASKIANGLVSNTEFQYLNGVTSSIQDQLDSITTADITRIVASISTNTSAGAAATTDYIYLVSGTTTMTMPTPVGNTNLYTIKRVGTNTVTISPNGSETFDGAASISILTRYDSYDLISDGTNWNIV